VPDCAVQPPVFQPVDVLGGGQLDMGQRLPGSLSLDELEIHAAADVRDGMKASERLAPEETRRSLRRRT